MPTLYEDLAAADQEIYSWQSDLYVPANEVYVKLRRPVIDIDFWRH